MSTFICIFRVTLGSLEIVFLFEFFLTLLILWEEFYSFFICDSRAFLDEDLPIIVLLNILLLFYPINDCYRFETECFFGVYKEKKFLADLLWSLEVLLSMALRKYFYLYPSARTVPLRLS